MTPDAERQTSASVAAVGVVIAVLVSIPLGFIGFGMGWNAALAQASLSTQPGPTPPPPPPIAQPYQPPVTNSITSPEPDYLRDPEAMVTIPRRIAKSAATTGRYRLLTVGNDRTVVAQVGIEGNGIDSVVFSWGQTIRQPVAFDQDELADLPDQLFDFDDAHLRAIPPLVAATLNDHPGGTTIDRVTIHALAGRAAIQLDLVHPRIVLEPKRFDLDGKPLPDE